jgi:acyl-CoA synthetase (AMP-forming)/AMP-acid ligase II
MFPSTFVTPLAEVWARIKRAKSGSEVLPFRPPDTTIARYRTGDVGRLDPEGRLIITGRKQSFVDIAGYKVDIGEVEEVLEDCPGVLEAAALGVTIKNMGTLIKAVVVAKEGWREAQIRAFCRERLAFVKVPRLIELRPSLPRASTGKILKSELRDVTPYLDSIRNGETLRAIQQLSGALPAQRRRLTRIIVQTQAAAVLGLSPKDIPDEQGFSGLRAAGNHDL